MLFRIMRHEWRNLVADRTLLVAAPLLTVVVSYGVYNGVSWVHFQNRTLAFAQREEVQRYDELKSEIVAIDSGAIQPVTFTDPRSPAVVSSRRGTRYAMMPPAPLAALSVGQSDLYPYYFKVSRQSKQTFITNDEIENPTNLLSGKFDLTFVAIFLYSLMILALSYNLISVEKEQGTLQMMMSQPITLKSFVFGKVCLRAGVVVGLAVGFSLIGFLSSGIELTAASWWRFGLWVAVVMAYGGFWFALAVMVNAFGRSSTTNVIIMAGLWLILVLIIPSLLNVAATTIYQMPSRVEMIQAMRRASTEASNKGSQLLTKYYEDHPEFVPANGKPDLNDFYAKS
ncbi:MAG: ABC transporter permease, partial [Acidobacteriota bacterium]